MNKNPVQKLRERSDFVVGEIEKRLDKLEPRSFLWAAAGASLLAAAFMGARPRRRLFEARQRSHLALFVGEWVPSLLLLGLYRKLERLAGSERPLRDRFRGQAE